MTGVSKSNDTRVTPSKEVEMKLPKDSRGRVRRGANYRDYRPKAPINYTHDIIESSMLGPGDVGHIDDTLDDVHGEDDDYDILPTKESRDDRGIQNSSVPRLILERLNQLVSTSSFICTVRYHIYVLMFLI